LRRTVFDENDHHSELRLPNATALSLSAVLFMTGVAEQGYKRIEALTGRIGGEISRELSEAARAAALPEAERAKRQATA
jgi:hypothetical protein